MATHIGRYVRVSRGKNIEGVSGTALYIAGYPTPAEAEAAVRKCRLALGAQYEVLGEIVRCVGPQPAPGEVRLIDDGV